MTVSLAQKLSLVVVLYVAMHALLFMGLIRYTYLAAAHLLYDYLRDKASSGIFIYIHNPFLS